MYQRLYRSFRRSFHSGLLFFFFFALQERNEQEGKVAAIKSLQQWRLTDVELHNFINRSVMNGYRHVCVQKAPAARDTVNQCFFFLVVDPTHVTHVP